MTADLLSYHLTDREQVADAALARLSGLPVASQGWQLLAVDRLADALMADAPRYRISSAMRAIAYQPNAADVRSVAQAVLDAVTCHAYRQAPGAHPAAQRQMRETIDSIASKLASTQAVEELTTEEIERVIEGIHRVMKMRDPELVEHMISTAALAARIARELGLPPVVIRDTQLAALLHDVGKISVELDTRHPVDPIASKYRLALIGERFVLDSPDLAFLAPIIRAQCERFDGTGGPDGDAGDAIPVEARIIAVADALHTLLSSSPVRTSTMPRDAFEVVQSRAGTEFDPTVVAAASRVVGVRSRRLTA
jgi:HD-GYP domain-containing protein (c-di-GMP phosphodiesterase class II)